MQMTKTTLLKNMILYNHIIKMKPYWLSHIAVWSFLICEAFIFILTFYETISEQIDLKNGIVPDYILGFNTYFMLNQLIGLMLLGFFLIALFILFLIIKFLFKKNFLIKTNFLTNNFIYHVIWTFGIYATTIIFIFTTIYLVSISYEGILWLLDK